MIILPYFVKSVIFEMLLSDGYIIYSAKSKNARLAIFQSLGLRAYINFYLAFWLTIVLGILCLQEDLDLAKQYII